MASSTVDTEVCLATMFDPHPNSYIVLCHATYIIEGMGHFLLIPAKQDFSLSRNTEYSYIKYRDSFRACASQLSKGVWESFHTAHNCMKQIYMKSVNIDKHLEKAAEVIQRGTKAELILARLYLHKTEKSCTECAEIAASITKAFDTVAKMMSELKQALIESKKKYKDKGPKAKIIKAYRQEQEQRDQREKSFQKIREQKGVPHLQFFPAEMLLAGTFASRGIPSALTSTNQTAEASSTLPDLGPNSSNENGVNDSISQKTNNKNNAEINYEGKDVLLEHCRRYKPCHDQILEEPKELMRVLDDHEKRQSNLDELDRMQLTLDKCINALIWLLKHWKEITNMFHFFYVMLQQNLKEDGKKLEQIAQQMKRISSLYVEISETYLLDGLIHLQRIETLEPSTHREKMKEIKKELQDDQKKARDGILALAEESKRKLRETIKNLPEIE